MRYVKVLKSIQESPIWEEETVGAFQAYFDLLLMSDHGGFEMRSGAKVVTCKRGELWVSERYLERRWSWSRGAVGRYLKRLHTLGAARIRASKEGTLICVGHLHPDPLITSKSDPPNDPHNDPHNDPPNDPQVEPPNDPKRETLDQETKDKIQIQGDERPESKLEKPKTKTKPCVVLDLAVLQYPNGLDTPEVRVTLQKFAEYRRTKTKKPWTSLKGPQQLLLLWEGHTPAEFIEGYEITTSDDDAKWLSFCPDWIASFKQRKSGKTHHAFNGKAIHLSESRPAVKSFDANPELVRILELEKKRRADAAAEQQAVESFRTHMTEP